MIASWFATAWTKIVAIGAIILGILVVMMKLFTSIKKSGASDEKARESAAIEKSRNIADEIDNTVHNADDATSNKLRDKWSRD